MKKERLISIGIKLGVFGVIFIISVIVSSKLLNRGTTDMTAEMRKATLPVIYMNVNDEYINPLHGYLREMDSGYMRGALTPLQANRQVSFKIDPYGSVITGIAFEVRSMESGRLIEDTALTDYETGENGIRATISLKDLIDDETEYTLIIKITNGLGEEIRYYTRIINKAELLLSDKFNFVRTFSQKTFIKECIPELKKYMESNSEGDNSSFAYVNIHSNINQLTWGDLEPVVCTDKNLELLEVDSDNASILLSYQVVIKNELHNVKEYYRIRVGKDRMHLMEYERTCNQLFDESKNILVKDKILHGIINEKLQYSENPNGSIFCFVQQNGLFSFNTANNNIAKVFSFWDKDENDARTRLDEHDIKILNVDEAGNIRFIVYGYMNRGNHEGEVGVAIYYYDSVLNTIEEEVYVPYNKSYEMLKQDMEHLSYVNSRNMFYVMLDGSVYDIRLETRKADVVATGLSENRFVATKDNSIIAWQTGTSVDDYSAIKILALDEIEPKEIMAGNGEIVIPLGFMEKDFIYGCARISDIAQDATGSEIVPMYSIKIQDSSGNLVKEYRQENVYVLSLLLKDNMISLERISKNEEGIYEAISDDQIMDNQNTASFKNKLTSVVTEEMETTYQTVLAKSASSDSVKVLTPKELMYEGSKSVELTEENLLTRYFVYAKGEIQGIYTNPAEAVRKAEEMYGVVVNRDSRYVWQSFNRKGKTQIVSLEDNYSDEEHSTVYVCLSEMLKSKDIFVDINPMISSNRVLSVLKEAAGEYALDLEGCSLSSVLYYVSEGYPVMVVKGDGNTLLIVGYDSKNTIIFDPLEGKTRKMGMNDSTEFFLENKNRFITFVR